MNLRQLYRPSLADRIKGNKRQRSDSQTKEPKAKEKKSPASASSTPVKKAKVSSTPTKSTGPSGPISSTYLSSSTKQLTCLSESLAADEKFERMLDELFDLGKVASAKHKSRDSSSEDTDEEDSHNKKPKTNGDSTPALFDITLTPETLYHFVGVTAKLKRNNKMKSAPTSKITTLLTALTQQLTVQSAGLKRRKSVDEQNDSDDDDEDSNITTSTQLLHKFESCCDCSVVSLNILSSKGK